MIDKIANNKFNTENLNLNSTEKIKEKLNYYRSLFGKTHDLPLDDFKQLQQDIATFFNVKPGIYTTKAPKRIIRISNNNRILKAQGKELSYLTDISQLLAPPISNCEFGRCNIPKQQVLYCALSEACAYWETKPKSGDIITLSHFELKPEHNVRSYFISAEKPKTPEISHQLQEIYYLLEEFFVDAYSLLVSKDRNRDYIFSGTLSSEMLFYPIVNENNFEAIIYPSVQKKKHGENFAIRNDLIFEKYNLIGVETRFILNEYENLDPTTDEVTTDQVIGSFTTTAFDFKRGKILYNEEKADEIFKIFRMMQTNPRKQIRYEHEGIPKNIPFNLSPIKRPISNSKKTKIGRNDRINIVYQNGVRKDNIKYKVIQEDLEKGSCRIVEY